MLGRKQWELEQLSSAIDDYISARLEAKPDKWPNKGTGSTCAAKRAKQITLVTHAPSLPMGCPWHRAQVEGRKGGFLSTASLAAGDRCDRQCGGAGCGQSVAAQADGKRLVDQIQDGDASSLAVFTKDKGSARGVVRWPFSSLGR